MADGSQMERRQRVLADFGDFALRSDDLDAVLTQACRLVAEAMGTGRAKVLEIQDQGRTLFVRAGVGWDEGVVGRVRLPMTEPSSETFSIDSGGPVIANDLASEDRFEFTAFMKEAGIRALVNVPIFLPGGRAFGLLQVDATEPRPFGDEDTQFLRTYATILGPVIDRLLKAQALGITEERFRAIVEAARDYAIFITDPQDRIVDWLPGAEAVFGWTAKEAVGQDSAILFTHEDREAGVPEAEVRTAREHGSAPNVRWHLRKDGTRVLIEGTVVALRDAAGGLRGFQKIGQDVTKSRLAEEALRESSERQAVLLKLSDAVRPLVDPIVIQETACRITAEHLDIGRVAYCQIRYEPDAVVVVERDRPRRGMPSLVAGSYRMDDFGPLLARDLLAGRTALVADVETDPRITPAERDNWASLAIRASCALPVIKDGRFVAFLVAQDNRRHDWTETEIALLQDVSERIWSTLERARAEAALRESEARLAAAFESVPAGVAVTDPKGKAILANSEYRRFLPNGVIPSRDRDRGHRWHAWDDEGRPIAQQDFPSARALRGQRVIPGQEMLYTDDGGRAIWTNVATAPTFDRAGRVTGCITVISDITDRKRAEEELRRREEELRVITDNVPAMIGFYDREFRYRVINEEYSRYFDKPKDEILGRTVAEVAGERAFASLRPWMERALAGERVRIENESSRVADPTSLGWTEENYIPHVDGNGAVDGFYALVFDITERKRAERALRESEGRFRALVTAGSYMVYRMSPDWRQMYALSGQNMLADTTEPIEDWADEYLLPDDRPTIFAAIDEAIRTKSLFELEHRVRQADGSVGWVFSRAVPIFGPDGEIVEWFGAGSDVTVRREAQEKLREAEARYRTDLERQVRERTAELQASRDLLQATMDASTDMIHVFEAVRNESGEIVDFRWLLNNHTSERLFGDVRGESLLQRNPGVVVEGIFDTFKRVTETGVPDQAERRYAHEQFDGWFYQSVVKLGDGVATTTKDITEWKSAQDEVLRLQQEVAQARLRESEERFRLLVESVRDYAIFTIDREGIITSWPAGAAAVYGWSEAEILGRSVEQTFVPEDVASGAARAEMELAAREGLAPNVRWHLHKNGSRIFIDGSTQPLVSADGEIREFIKIGQDVTQARRVQQALAESEARLRTLTEGIPQLVWRSGDAGRWTWSSPQWQAFTGQRLEESVGHGWLEALHPDDRDAAMQAWAEAPGKGSIDVEYRVRRASDGAYLWHHTRSLPVRNAGGRITEWLGTTTDVQQLKELQERQSVLVAELQHRTRNLIAVVRSIAHQTMAQTGPTEAFREEFDGRLEALARVQGLLSRSDEEPVTIEGLIRMELDALGMQDGGSLRITLTGPSVRLRNSIVQILALGLHELATNARKHGALSRDGGRLSVAWQVFEADGGDRRLTLEWVESGAGVPLDAERRGYGRELIERALPYALGAKTTFELGPEGARCTIDLPLDKRRRRR